MKIVQTDEIPLKRGLEHRGGMFHGRNMMEGEPGAIDNFQLSFGQMGGDFVSPRHRHNFEQIRFQLEGELNFARDGKLMAGMVGYFPEAVYYGPQSQEPNRARPSCCSSAAPAAAAICRRRRSSRHGGAQREGEFKDGVFRRRAEGEGKRNIDGYQAIWEHANGRPMAYPKPRYPQPIMMDPANYEWVPLADRPACARSCSACSPSGAAKPAVQARCRRELRGARQGRLSRRARRGHGRRRAAARAHHGLCRRRRDRHVRGAGGDRAAAFRPAQSRRPAHARARAGPRRGRGVGGSRRPGVRTCSAQRSGAVHR